MHNDVGYWIKRWQEGQTAFHQSDVTGALLRHGSALGEGGRILVPLCGKSHDLTWLAREKGHSVVGIEIADTAISEYFEELRMTAMRTTKSGIQGWHGGGVTILEADFFAVTPDLAGKITAAYDRAALIAMPPEVQQKYADHLRALVGVGGRILLVGFSYDPREMQGPPFAIGDAEVQRLYGATCDVEKLEERNILAESPRFADRGVTWLLEATYLMTVRSV